MIHHVLTRTVAVVGVTAALLLTTGPAATAAPTPPVAASATVHPAGLGDFIGGLPCRLFGMC